MICVTANLVVMNVGAAAPVGAGVVIVGSGVGASVGDAEGE